MAGPRVAHATLKGLSVVKDIIIGITLGLAASGVWKVHHWNNNIYITDNKKVIITMY